MYGSSLMTGTLRPRDSRIAGREAEAMPLPREDTTPPVTKTNLVMSLGIVPGRATGGTHECRGGKARLYAGAPQRDPVLIIAGGALPPHPRAAHAAPREKTMNKKLMRAVPAHPGMLFALVLAGCDGGGDSPVPPPPPPAPEAAYVVAGVTQAPDAQGGGQASVP